MRRAPALLMGILLLVAGPIGCAEDVAEPGAEVSAVVQDPAAFGGRTFVMTGEVESIMRPGVFTVEDPDEPSANMTVISRVDPATLPVLSDDDVVQLEGELRVFRWAEVEPELGWDLGREYEVRFEGATVFVASSVRKIAEE